MTENAPPSHLHPRYGLGSQLQSALHGLLAGASGDEQGNALLRTVVHLAESLVAKHRLELEDFHERADKDAWLSGTGLESIARCVPLVLWLRGPDPRLALAAFRLAWSTERDSTTAYAAAFACLWLRVLVRPVGEGMGWEEAKERLQRMNEDIHPPFEGIEEFLERLDTDDANPICAGLRTARAQLVEGGTPDECIARLRAHGAGPGLRALTAALAGIRERPFGEHEPALPTQEDARLAALFTELTRPWLLSRRLEVWAPITSQTHPLAIPFLEAGPARIGVSPCPGCCAHFVPGGIYARSLSLDAASLAEWGARHLLCVLDNDSLLSFVGGNLQPELERHGIHFWHVPWLGQQDSAWFDAEWRRVRAQLVAAARRGESVVLSGLDFDCIALPLAAELLRELRDDLGPEEALAQLRQVATEAEEALHETRRDV